MTDTLDQRPSTPLLDKVTSTADLHDLTDAELTELAHEVRSETISTVSVTGGHLGASLGVVELTVAIHAVFNTRPFQRGVAVHRPRRAPPLQNLDLVPVAVLLGKTRCVDLPRRQHDMGVVVSVIALPTRFVQSDIRHHAAINKFALAEIQNQLTALFEI